MARWPDSVRVIEYAAGDCIGVGHDDGNPHDCGAANRAKSIGDLPARISNAPMDLMLTRYNLRLDVVNQATLPQPFHWRSLTKVTDREFGCKPVLPEVLSTHANFTTSRQ